VCVRQQEQTFIWNTKILQHKINTKKTRLEAKDVLPNINRMQAAERAKKGIFVPGDLDLDPQTRLSEGPNMSSV